MTTIENILAHMRSSPQNIRFAELSRVCDFFFGQARQKGSSHRTYKTPWPGDPRVNIQNHRGMAKAYQVRQVVRAIELLEERHGTQE